MYEPIVAWAGLALLFVLCLPIRAVRKLVLELAAPTYLAHVAEVRVPHPRS